MAGLLKKLLGKKEQEQPAAKAPDPFSYPFSFLAVTFGRHEKDLTSLAERTPAFQLSDEDFIKRYKSDRKVYQFKFKEMRAELVPEPTNKYDPNAIMIVVDGLVISYVPRAMTETVRRRMTRPYRVTVKPRGGPWKRNVDGLVEIGMAEFKVNVVIENAPPGVCPNCGNPATGKFCGICGAPL